MLLGDLINGKFVIMLTFNGGHKWEKQTLKSTADLNGEGAFAASNSSLLLSSTDYRSFGTGGPGGSRIITVGAGPTDVYEGDVSKTKKLPWSSGQVAVQLPTHHRDASSGVFSIAEDPHGMETIAVGGDYKKPNDRLNTAWRYDVAHYDEANHSFWSAAQTPPHGFRSAVAWDAQQKLWITVGPNGTDISRDDGLNWTPSNPQKKKLQMPTKTGTLSRSPLSWARTAGSANSAPPRSSHEGVTEEYSSLELEWELELTSNYRRTY